MTENEKLPRPDMEKLNEYDQLREQLCSSQLTDEQLQDVINKLNDLMESYDWDIYAFDNPETNKKGVKNPAGETIVPAEFDDVSLVDNSTYGTVSHIAAMKGGKWGIVAADGTGKALCDFRFDTIQWYPFAGLYIARWNGIEDKFGFVTSEGNELIPNVLTAFYEPWNGFMQIESNGKYGALDVRTGHYVLPEYDNILGAPDDNILFIKDGIEGYVIEETGEFVPKDLFHNDEKYNDAFVFNAYV